MNINTILSLASLVIFAMVLLTLYMKSKSQSIKVEVESFSSLEKVLEAVKNEMVEMVRTDYSQGISDSEFSRLYKRKARINDALKNCVYGIDAAKAIVIDLIRKFIADNIEPTQITLLLGLSDENEPSAHVKFEILMYKFKQTCGKDALVKWIEKYHLDEEHQATGSDKASDTAYYITEYDLEFTYDEENYTLSVEEQTDILAIIIYQMYKGFGVVDTLREMNINGFNMGTSGSILSSTNKQKSNDFKANKSVWLYDRGKYIHLRFLDLGTEEELRRIIQLLIRWGNPGPLTSKRGYLVNTMYDKSRILALRPPASEYWAVFIRKFTLSDNSPEWLLIKPYTKRGDLVVKMIELLIKGQITCAVTGRQGSGKTTLMTAIIRYINPKYNIRVLEMAPELYIRELYPTRNILSVAETSTVSASALQDALKKSDAAVSIVGEVATALICARMVEMACVASIFTIFSHHANTAKDLVYALRNNLVDAEGFSPETAEKQIIDILKCDIHMDYTPDGKRYVERISEIIPLAEGMPYPEYDPKNKEDSMAAITREHYVRQTDRVRFKTHDILRYDLATHTYYAVDRPSEELEAKIRATLASDVLAEYDLFMLKNWGLRDKGSLTDTEVEAQIAELEKTVITNTPSEQSQSQVDMGNYSSLSEEQLANESNIANAWKSGYTPSAGGQSVSKTQPTVDTLSSTDDLMAEFGLGLFDDSDYN